VRALSLINVLDVRQGDGTYVTSLEPGLLLRALEFVVDLHQDDTVLHLFQVRMILEPAATAMAATLMSDTDIADLRHHLDALPQEPDVEELVASDLEFHHKIAVGSGNPVLCSFIDSLSGPTQRARVWRGVTQTGATERTINEHRAILEAIASRQPEVARSLAVVHVSGIEQWLRAALDAR
jgi:GntR family transcriptional repressor for pyruvate dehydrogenase complex